MEKISEQGAYQVTDSEGYVVKIGKKPMRILTVSAGTDETMLGLVEPERMVAVNNALANKGYSNVPWVGDKIPTVIARNPSVEQVAALTPDLVVVTTASPKENIDAIRDLGIPVVVVRGVSSIEDIHYNIRLLAKAVDEEERGERLIAKMSAKLQEIQAKIAKIPDEKKHKSLAIISVMPSYGGAGCIFDDMCRYTDSINAKAVVGNRMGQEMPKEQLVLANPDYIFLPNYNDTNTTDERHGRQYIEDESLANMTAIKEKQIGYPGARYIYNTSQNVVFGIQETAWILYGDEFSQSRYEFITAVE